MCVSLYEAVTHRSKALESPLKQILETQNTSFSACSAQGGMRAMHDGAAHLDGTQPFSI